MTVGEIEIVGGVEIKQAVERAMPVGSARPMGAVKPNQMQVFMPRSILEKIVSHSCSRLDVEVGGLLVGSLCSWRGVNWIDIRGYIAARHAVHTPASLRFTNETFEAAWKEKDEVFPDDIFVGWHHTHPGYGCFLSSTDMFTCRSFFNLPWMLALVVDPRAQLMEFYQWRSPGGDMEACGFYYTS
jgi:proteasome lid subunit RPN8/RPN11